MTDAPWWIEDYETNIIHLWSDSDDYYGVCGATFEIHGIAHTRWDMEPEKVRELSGQTSEPSAQSVVIGRYATGANRFITYYCDI